MNSFLDKALIFILAVLLVISLGFNGYQFFRKPTDQPIEIVRDTVVFITHKRDTVYENIVKEVIVERPVPVYVDAEKNIREYKDTVKHEYGSVFRRELVEGVLLQKDIKFDFNIPTVFDTTVIHQTITVNKIIKEPQLFATFGFRTGYETEKYIPTIGLLGVSKGHKWAAGVDFGWDKQMQIKIGYNFLRR